MNYSNNRNFGLDLIRASAITLVVISHLSFLLFPESESSLVTFLRVLGALGVDLFFVLSGYLIGGIILKNIEQNKTSFNDLLNFWKRRWFRTLPNYFFILFVNIFIYFLVCKKLPDQLGYYFIFLQNFEHAHPNFFTEAWSLSIEEYAYLFLPLLLYAVIKYFKKNNRSQLFLYTTLVVIFILQFFKVYYYYIVEVESYKAWSRTFRKVVLFRLDAIYIGFILIYFVRAFPHFFKRFKGVFFVLGLIIFILAHAIIALNNLLPESALWFYVFIYLHMVIISFGLMFPYLTSIHFNGVFSKLVSYLSLRSYAVYLINYSIVLLSIEKFYDSRFLHFYERCFWSFIFVSATLVLSELLYRLFEKPILNYRDRKYSS
ncbi:acyltransferase [Urechidicola sp. KH5]